MLKSAKNCEGNEKIFSHFLKLRKVLSVCPKFPVFGILPSETKSGRGRGVILPSQEQIRGQNTRVDIEHDWQPENLTTKVFVVQLEKAGKF